MYFVLEVNISQNFEQFSRQNQAFDDKAESRWADRLANVEKGGFIFLEGKSPF